MKLSFAIGLLILAISASAQMKWTLVATFDGSGVPYFLNENYGFFIGGTGVQRTTDAGRTWMPINGGFQVGAYTLTQLIFESPSHIYIYGGGPIYESFDSGLTWKSFPDPSPGAYGIYVFNGTIYVSGCKMSSDDGQTWTNIPPIPGYNTIVGNKENAIAIFSLGVGRLDQGTIFSVDGGNTWQVGQSKKDESWSGYAVPHTLTYFRASENTNNGLGGGNLTNPDSNVILRTKDGGNTWQKVSPNVTPFRLTGGIAGGGCCVYAQTKYGQIPSDYQGLWRSKDLGNVWDTIGGPSYGRDTRISVVARGAICYACQAQQLFKFVDSAILKHDAKADLSMKYASASISHDSLFVTMCDSAKIALDYGFTSCDYVKLNGIWVEGIPASDYRTDFIQDQVIMEGRAGKAGITFLPSAPGEYHIRIHTYIMRDDWVREDTAFNLILEVKSNPAILVYLPHDTIYFSAQSLCNNHFVGDTIRIANKGCENLVVNSIKLETDAGSNKDFMFTNISNLSLHQTDSTRKFPFGYFPKSVGNKSGRIIINTSLGIDTIFLNGNVTANGTLSLNDAKIDFDTVSTCSSLTKSAYLVNNACDSILVTEFYSLNQSDFVKISPQLPFELNVGDSLLVTITYTPKKVGLISDSITFLGKSSAGKSEYLTLVLTGFGETGRGKLSFSPQSFAFKALSICYHDSASGNITNSGCDSLQLDPAQLFSDPDYHITGFGSQIPVAPQQTLSYEVYLDPAQKGFRQGIMVLTSRSGGNIKKDSIRFSVTVKDGTRILSASETALDFGTISVCDEKDTSVTLNNFGCDTLILTGFNVSGSGFIVTTAFPDTILPHQSKEVAIATLLDTAGGKMITSGSLSFKSNSDTTISPITLARTFSVGAPKAVGLFLDPTPKSGGDKSEVFFDIKESAKSSFVGAGINQIGFDLTGYNHDLLTLDMSNSSKNLTSTGDHFALKNSQEITANPNGVLASIAFTVYLTTDSTTTITLSNVIIDSMHVPCGTTTLSASGSAFFDYKFACGEYSLQNFMNRILPLKIISIRPNPAQEEIDVEIASEIKQEADVEIFDALGVNVSSVLNTLSIGNNTIRLDTRNLNKGMFLLRVKSTVNETSQSFLKIN